MRIETYTTKDHIICKVDGEPGEQLTDFCLMLGAAVAKVAEVCRGEADMGVDFAGMTEEECVEDSISSVLTLVLEEALRVGLGHADVVEVLPSHMN